MGTFARRGGQQPRAARTITGRPHLEDDRMMLEFESMGVAMAVTQSVCPTRTPRCLSVSLPMVAVRVASWQRAQEARKGQSARTARVLRVSGSARRREARVECRRRGTTRLQPNVQHCATSAASLHPPPRSSFVTAVAPLWQHARCTARLPPDQAASILPLPVTSPALTSPQHLSMADPAGNSAPRNGVEAPISSVLIMVAMDAEAAPIIDALGLTPKDIDLCVPHHAHPATCNLCAGPCPALRFTGVCS